MFRALALRQSKESEQRKRAKKNNINVWSNYTNQSILLKYSFIHVSGNCNSSEYQTISATNGEELRLENCTKLPEKNDSVDMIEVSAYIPHRLRIFSCKKTCGVIHHVNTSLNEANLTGNVTAKFNVNITRSSDRHFKVCSVMTISKASPAQPKCYQLQVKYKGNQGHNWKQTSTFFNIVYQGELLLCNLKWYKLSCCKFSVQLSLSNPPN